MNSFDIDGVIYMGNMYNGLRPGPQDIIITGRSFEEAPETLYYLKNRGIDNQVFFSPVKYSQKTRELSGKHKANIINVMKPQIHFEDDEIQIEVIQRLCPEVQIVQIVHNLINKENQRHGT